MSVSSVAIQFTIIDLLSKGVDRIRTRMASLAKGNAEVQRSFDRMAKSAKYAAIAGVATRELYKGLKPAVGAAGELQAEMLGTRAELAGAARNAKDLEAQLKQVKSTAFTIQAWTPFDQSQIVALEKQLLKSGAKIEQVVGQQGAAAASAALGTYEELDPVQMGKNLIGIATPFKMQADQFMSLADEISRAASASTVGAAEIAETARYAAPSMSQLGKSTHEMLVLSAMLAQRGIEASMAGTGLRQFFNSAAKHKVFRDAAGDLLPLSDIVGLLKTNLAGLGEAEQLAILTKIFDVRGAPVALALMEEGAASFEQIEAAMAQALPLSEKLRIKMMGLAAQWTSLKGTGRSTLASLYQPALEPLGALVGAMNDFVALIGQATQGSDALAKAVSGISLGALATGGAATLGLGGAALYYGKKTLTGAGGIKGLLSGTVAGIATGKAVEAATGVQPVFVTNWPANYGMGTPAPESLGQKAGKVGWLGLLGRAGVAGLAALGINEGMKFFDADLSAIGRSLEGLFEAQARIAEVLRGERDWQTGQPRQPIELNLTIDEQRRVTTESSDADTRLATTLRRGRFSR
jgi:TP901 family phage tail tape measure protein